MVIPQYTDTQVLHHVKIRAITYSTLTHLIVGCFWTWNAGIRRLRVTDVLSVINAISFARYQLCRGLCAEWRAPLSRWLQWRWWTRDVPCNLFCYFSSTLRGLYGKNWPWRIKSGVRHHVSDVVDVTELALLALTAWLSSAGADWHLLTALALECVTQNMSKMRHGIDFKY